MQKKMLFLSLLCCLLISFFTKELNAQAGDCAYPIIFIHGWTGDYPSFEDTYADPAFVNLWGAKADNFYSVQNASFSTNIWGNDGIPGNGDDDVLTWFTNETNELASGCVYAVSLDNVWNQEINNPIILKGDADAISATESDSNEAGIYKAGVMLKNCITAVLAANPGKEKVILVGHSMGGLHIREYLQRRSPATPTGTPLWWVDPTSPDGHKVARAVTTVTPHGGSNTFGNLFGLTEETTTASRDGLPDYFSSGLRDLRYNWSCGFLGLSTCTAAYLYGGDEAASYGWWNEDVNCDGDENDTNIVGLNIKGTTQGVGDEWDGTYDNPNIPLPTNIHYTWMTSDILGDDGDGVVHWSRQWLYNNNDVALPFDGVAWRLSDTLLVYRFHLDANDYAQEMIRSLDEPDYPKFAYKIELDKTYTNVLTRRSNTAPEGLPSTDVDFFKVDIPADYDANLGLEIHLTTHNTRTVQVSYYASAPADYISFTDMGNINNSYMANTGSQVFSIPSNLVIPGGTAYLKIQADDIGFSDWRTPIPFMIKTAAPLAIDLTDFWGKKEHEKIDLQWKTTTEIKADRFIIERSPDGVRFGNIGEMAAKGTSNTTQVYQFLDEKPFKGHNYYRLKSLDLEGSFDYSKTLHFVIKTEETTLIKVYPVPTDRFAIIELENKQAQELQWFIADAIGRQVKAGTQSLNEGEAQVLLSLEGLATGVYVVHLEAGDFRGQVRMLKR